MASKKVKNGISIARIDVINAKNAKLGKANVEALLRSIRDTLEAAHKPEASKQRAAKALTADASIECWIAEVTFEIIDGILYRVEFWECEDGSSYKKYLPIS